MRCDYRRDRWSIWYISGVNFEKEMRRNYGRIYPDSIDVSDAACAPKDSVLLFAGSNNIQLTQFPYLFLIIDGDPIIVVDKQSDGALTIKYLLLNDDNEQNLARIDDSEFWINPSIQRFMVPRRDRLVIADHSGHPALNLAFLNPTHLSLSGRFVHHGFVVDIGLTYIDIAIPVGPDILYLPMTVCVISKYKCQHRVSRWFRREIQISSSLSPSRSKTARQARKKDAAKVPRASFPVIEVSVSSPVPCTQYPPFSVRS